MTALMDKPSMPTHASHNIDFFTLNKPAHTLLRGTRKLLSPTAYTLQLPVTSERRLLRDVHV
jgi:hypothetical protein